MISIFLFTTCQKQETNCRNSVLVSLDSPTNSFPRTTFSGNLNIDCTIINVPEQAIGSAFDALGNIFVNSTTIDGVIQGDTYIKIDGSK